VKTCRFAKAVFGATITLPLPKRLGNDPFSVIFIKSISHFLHILLRFFPDYGASAHFRSSPCQKMRINAVFAQILRRSTLKLCIHSSFLQIQLGFFQIMERLLIFVALPAQNCA